VLALLVDRGMSYESAAAALGTSRSTVRDRAQLALAMLAPAQARDLPGEEREQVGDYMLGQQDGDEQDASRRLIESSAPASAWAHALSHELSGEQAPAEPAGPAAATAGNARAPAGNPRGDAPGSRATATRRRNLLALTLVSAVAIVAIVLAVVLGGSSKSSSTSTSTTSRSQPKIVGHAILASPSGARSAGLFEVLKGGSKLAYYIAAVGLEPTSNFYYALWLSNGPGKSRPLNRAPAVKSNGRIVGGALLPTDATSYREVLLTRETQSGKVPSSPGETILKGTIQYAR